ncbi:outer membrane beta-barrel protein [Lysobacter koreensis]|uniref:Outer membrane beta-barrel protein n=1 Tax=Lysobacter koreensis TaxID=266122 RepID=A0ABW2YIY3_9GAMM
MRRALASGLALTLAAALPAPALDLDYDVGAYLRHSDNINLSPNAPQDDNVVAPTLRFELSQAGADVQLSGIGLLQYTDYLDDTFKDELRAGFAGGLDWAIVPERLNLVFQDYLSQQNINDLDSSTPDNLQHVNLFVMGPSLHTRFNPATRGQFDLRYGNTYAEESEAFKGDRYSAAARVRRELNPTTEIAGNLEAAKIEYDRVGSAANYERYDAYLSYKLRRVALDLDLDAGYSQLDRAAGAGTSSSPLLRAVAAYKLTPRSTLRADVRRQYTDATQYLITPVLDFSDRRFSELAYRDISIDPNVFRERSVRVGYEFNGIRTSARVQPYIRRIDYFNPTTQDQDQDLKGVAFDIEYRPRPLLSLSLYASQEKRDYDDLARNDQDTLIDVGVTKRFTRHWSASFHVSRRERDSAVPGQDYRENSAQLSFNYRR